MKKITVFAALLMTSIIAAAAPNEPSKTPVNRDIQVYKKSELQTWDRDNIEGGVGVLNGKFAYTRYQTNNQDAIREIGWLTLPKGAAISVHQHKNNEDVYLIVSGEGEFTDGKGNKTIVRDGDITIARPGQSHGLRNIGQKPLVFINFSGQLPDAAAEHKH